MKLLKRVAFIAALLIAVALLLLLLRVIWLLVFPPQPGLAAVSIGISEALVETLVLVVAAFAIWRVWRLTRRHSHASNRSS